MKKTILLSAIALISFSTFAQDKGSKGSDDSRVRYGVKAGVTFADVTLSSAPGVTTSSVTSFYVGGIVDIPVASVLSVQPGLMLVGKGAELSFPSIYSQKQTPFYLEVPVNLVAKFEAGPGKIFVGAGPYVSLGVFGKNKITSSSLGNSNDNLKFGNGDDDDLRSIDFGLNFLLGYQLTNGLSVNGGYGLGLVNTQPSASSLTVKNSVFSVGLGFAF